MTEPIDPVVQRVVITGNNRPSDEVKLYVNGALYTGWTEVRVTRGVERMPSDFDLRLTDLYGDPSKLVVQPGNKCVVKIGADPVVTGYIDTVAPEFDARHHVITVTGRSKCADLVDCSAEWDGGQIVGSTILEVARKLAQPYGIDVDTLDDPGQAVPQFNLSRGETAWAIIERLARYSQLLAYDDTDGNLLLSRVTTTRRAGSGFQEGVNIVSAKAAFSQAQRFSEYRAYLQSMSTLDDIGGAAADLLKTALDAGVKRHRVHMIVAELGGGEIGIQLSQFRAEWEAARRYGRSAAIQVVTDSWRDVNGLLYEPNTLALVNCPTMKVVNKTWAIAQVTYQYGEGGTSCLVTLMPPEAFSPQPTLIQPIPAELELLPPNLAGQGGQP